MRNYTKCGNFELKCTKMRLAAGLRPNPLVNLERCSGPGHSREAARFVAHGKGRPEAKRSGSYLRERFTGSTPLRPPSRNVGKSFPHCKKNTQCDMRALSGLSPLTCQEKPSSVYIMQKNALTAGAPPRTSLGEFTALLQTS